MRDTFLSTARREVTSKQGDVVKAIPLIEAAYQAESVLGLKGNAYALKNYLDRAERFAKDEAAEISKENEYWRNYVAAYYKNVAALLETGHSIPESWPHPDDIEFEDGCFVKFKGGDPIEASQRRALVIRFRDLFMLQAEKDRRRFCEANHKQRPPISVSDYLVHQFNASLPKRMQLDDIHLIMRMLRIQTLRKTVLEKRLHKEWTELSIPEALGLILPPIKTGKVV